MRYLILIAILLPSVGSAQGRSDLPFPCRIERLEHALVACIDLQTADVRMRMQARLATATSDLQAATSGELIKFNTDLMNQQTAWQRHSDRACAAETPKSRVRRALCQLRESKRRRDQLENALTQLRNELGATPQTQLPDLDSVEVLIPLEVPEGRGVPGNEIRLPLTIPISPD